MFGLFENYSTTRQKGKINPINVRLSPNMLYEKLVTYYGAKDFVSTQFNREYFELFLNDYGYEVTISIGHDNDTTSTIGIAVYNPSARGRTRRRLKLYHSDLLDFLKAYIA